MGSDRTRRYDYFLLLARADGAVVSGRPVNTNQSIQRLQEMLCNNIYSGTSLNRTQINRTIALTEQILRFEALYLTA